jgi:PAS domain S-box-containing protein
MNKPGKPLRLLLVEDNPDDAELLLRELRRSGFDPGWKRVDTEQEFLANLQADIDLIVSDYSMPGFSGLRALELRNLHKVDAPFIIVSGTIGEETAVEAMKSGAADYLLKDRLTRLGHAVKQALEQKQIRQERKRADETLDRLRRHHELILDSAGEGIYGIDLEGNIIFGNPKCEQLLGWSADELLGMHAHATLHHKKSDGTAYPVEQCPIHQAMRDGGTRQVNNDLFWRKDGTSLRVDYVAAPMREKDGRLTGTIVTFQDVTEQFAGQMRMKLQEQQYRLLFETNPNPMWVYDAKTLQILAANEVAAVQYGYSRSEFLQLNLKDLQPDDVPDLIKANGHSSIRSMPQFGGQFRHQRKNGSPLLVEVYSGAILWTGVAARIVTAIDITDRKKAEERLREQANTINLAHDAIIVRGFENREIISWNRGAERLYGWTADEALGKPIGSLLFADPADAGQSSESLLSTGEFRGEVKQITKSGSDVIVDGRETLVRNPDGSPNSVLIINNDITEQKKLETHLLRAQRLESIGTLASGVAHDLNNILAPILMCAEILRENPAREDAAGMIALIEDSARRGAGIVKQVLTFARGVEGERVLIKAVHLIEEMMEIARKTFPKSIEITGLYPNDLWSIQADPTQLHQVLLNLAVNARDALPDGGSITIVAENFNVEESFASATPGAKSGPHVIVGVSDTGTGITGAVIDKIFDPFFTTKEIGHGTGLGLSTVLGIVKSHGGFITVQSEIGKGTTFKVFLPAMVDSDGKSGKTEISAESLRGNGEVVLVVDDEPAILRLTKEILEKRNYRVLIAHESSEALAIFAREKDSINAVLTDILMPYMDGIELIRSLKGMRPDVRVIASTGEGEEAHYRELQELGVVNFLTKPYDAEKLITSVRDILAGI